MTPPSKLRDVTGRGSSAPYLRGARFDALRRSGGRYRKDDRLVARIMALVRDGRARLDRIVAVTFTEKAAGEMKLRLRGEIEHARASGKLDAEEQARFETALEQLELARIGTIHAFCADLLRERPVEARIDPFSRSPPRTKRKRLLDRAFDAWFERMLRDPPEGVRRVLRRRKRRRDDPSPKELLRAAAGLSSSTGTSLRLAPRSVRPRRRDRPVVERLEKPLRSLRAH